jgi:hypothetical protein
VDVQALERHIGTVSTSVDAFTLHDDAGVNVGSATFLGYGSSVIVTLSSPGQDVIGVAALHQGRGLRVQSGRVTEPPRESVSVAMPRSGRVRRC